MTTTDVPRLRDVLDRGEDLAEWLGAKGVEGFAEGVVFYDDSDPELDRKIADQCRREGLPFDRVVHFVWSAEVAESPDLADRVVDALPAALRDRLLSDRAERDEWSRRPWRLSVDEPTTFTCGNCGTDVHGPAIRGQWSGEDDEQHRPAWCVPCIELVLDIARTETEGAS